MSSQFHTPVEKSNIQIQTSLERKKETAQPVSTSKASDTKPIDPKFNLNFNNVSLAPSKKVRRAKSPNLMIQSKGGLKAEDYMIRKLPLKVPNIIQAKSMSNFMVSSPWRERVNNSIVQRNRLGNNREREGLTADELNSVLEQNPSSVQRSSQALESSLQTNLNNEAQIVQMMDTESEYDPTSDQEYDDAQDAIDDAEPAYEANIPYGKDQKTTDGNTTYYTPKDGVVDFDNPKKGTPITKIATVNITDDMSKISGVNKTSYMGNRLKASRSNHNTVANIMYEKKAPSANGSKSPNNYTWHHHKDLGRMDLLDRKEHAHIKHKGGHSIWGK